MKLGIIVIMQKYRGAAHSICNLKYNISKTILVTFHYGQTYFTIKELAKKFVKQFTCLGEKTEKYITFKVRTEKEVTRIHSNGEEITKNVSYRLKFIDKARFMASSLSNLVNNLSGGIHNIKN